MCVVKGFLFNWRSSIFNEVSINWCAQRRTWEASVFVLDVVCCYSCCSNIQRLFTRPHPPPPWCITFQCIPCSVRTLELDKLYIANQLKNVAIIILWLSWRKMNKSLIVQIYINAFLRCHQIWKVETLRGWLNFVPGF